MPAYDYRCETCHRRVTLTYKTYAEYDKAKPVCPRCGGTTLTPLIGRVAIAKSEEQRLGALDSEMSPDAMENADPETLGRYMRKMGDSMGEDMGDEFNEVVGRLERGESVEDIEQTMPLDDSADSGGFGGMGGFDE